MQASPPARDSEHSVSVVTTMGAIAPADWDSCANPGWGNHVSGDQASAPAVEGARSAYNPFLSHAFLSALEDSGCVGGRSGWRTAHVVVEAADGRIVGIAPAYIKSHSMGEYVFDHAWADAYERAGGRYYPKLQVSVPFTPATGRRLLIAAGADPAIVRNALVEGLRALRNQASASSIHVTFVTQAQWTELGEAGFLLREDQQFHWENAGYSGFEAFLEALASRKRKMIRRERRDALANGITIEHVTGAALTEAHWDAFHAFYEDTGSRKWGRPYLNRRFFSLIGERMPEHVLLVLAKREGRYIAGAINFIGSDTLFGRNWGCCEEHPFLHFEVCYYQAIDFAIGRGLARVEAGAQGEHKLARGYSPTLTYSAHDIADPGFRRAVSDYLVRERRQVESAAEQLAEFTPFKKG